MPRRRKFSVKQYRIVYVRSFLHYRTKRRVFPKPPRKFITLKIPIEKYLAYQKRKASAMKATTRTTKTAA